MSNGHETHIHTPTANENTCPMPGVCRRTRTIRRETLSVFHLWSLHTHGKLEIQDVSGSCFGFSLHSGMTGIADVPCMDSELRVVERLV